MVDRIVHVLESIIFYPRAVGMFWLLSFLYGSKTNDTELMYYAIFGLIWEIYTEVTK